MSSSRDCTALVTNLIVQISCVDHCFLQSDSMICWGFPGPTACCRSDPRA